jgi:4-diphosphocytidyl-2-C-methyl-D-erythritol kinase
MIVFPNAKINIGLNITEKRNDGFHNLETIFYPIKLSDILEVVADENSKTEVNFNYSGIEIPGDTESNLIVKAYHLLRKDFKIPNIKVHLEKIIPIGAGLGGGSSDAGFFINLINDKFELGLTLDDLSHYSKQLGSDCTFFLYNRPVYAFGKGDEIEQINFSLKGKTIALIKPPIHISTALAYSQIVPQKPKINLRRIVSDYPIENWKELVKNDFETSIFKHYPLIAEIKEKLYQLGALYASMSGSGSSVFGIFNDIPDLKDHFSGNFVWKGALI